MIKIFWKILWINFDAQNKKEFLENLSKDEIEGIFGIPLR